jgi:O-acetylhomoserine (thiol)-lyase
MALAHVTDGFSEQQHSLETRLAELEEGIGALLSPSGQQALAHVLYTLTSVGDNLVCAGRPGPVACQVFRALDELGVEVRVCPHQTESEIRAALDEHSKAIYCEALAAPSVEGARLEALSDISQSLEIPLVIDNALATAALSRCVEHGADIVVYTNLAYISAGVVRQAGAIIDSGLYDWAGAGLKIPKLNTPSPTCDNQIYTDKYGEHALLARCQRLMQDEPLFDCMTLNAISKGLDTLPERMRLYCSHTQRLVALLDSHPLISCINEGGYLECLTQQQVPFISLGLRCKQEQLQHIMSQLNARNATGPMGGDSYCIEHSVRDSYQCCSETEQLTAMAADNVVCLFSGTTNADEFYQTFIDVLGSVV